MGQAFPVQSPPISVVVVGLKSTVKSGNSTLNGLCCYKKVCGRLGLLHNNSSGAYHRLSSWTGGCVQHKLLAKHGLFLLCPAAAAAGRHRCCHDVILSGCCSIIVRTPSYWEGPLYSTSSSLTLQLRLYTCIYRHQRHVTFGALNRTHIYSHN